MRLISLLPLKSHWKLVWSTSSWSRIITHSSKELYSIITTSHKSFFSPKFRKIKQSWQMYSWPGIFSSSTNMRPFFVPLLETRFEVGLFVREMLMLCDSSYDTHTHAHAPVLELHGWLISWQMAMRDDQHQTRKHSLTPGLPNTRVNTS